MTRASRGRRRIARPFLLLIAAVGALLAAATPALAGGIVVTGADPDYHARPTVSNNAGGAQRLLQLSVAHVTEGQSPARLLLVTDTRNPGGDESDSRIGLRFADLTFDVADDGAAGGDVLDLKTVDFNAYDAIVVASDYGGWLRQEEVDILNARSAEIAGYVAAGGGFVVLAESGSRNKHVGVDSGRYGFVPVPTPIVGERLDQHEKAATVTDAGRAFGLTKADVNANATHAYFTGTGGLEVLSVDSAGRPITLATPKPPVPTPTPTPTPSATPIPGGGVGGSSTPGGGDDGSGTAGFSAECGPTLGFRSATLRPQAVGGRNGVLLRFRRRLARPVRVDVYQHSHGRKIYRKRLIARFTKRSRSVRWNGLATKAAKGRAATNGYYVVRYVMRLGAGRGTDVRRRTMRRVGGRFVRQGPKSTRVDCQRLRSARLVRPVFGGTRPDPLRLSFKLRRRVELEVSLVRGGRVLRSRTLGRPPRRQRQFLGFGVSRLPRGTYQVVLTATAADGSRRVIARLPVIRL